MCQQNYYDVTLYYNFPYYCQGHSGECDEYEDECEEGSECDEESEEVTYTHNNVIGRLLGVCD